MISASSSIRCRQTLVDVFVLWHAKISFCFILILKLRSLRKINISGGQTSCKIAQYKAPQKLCKNIPAPLASRPQTSHL